MAFGVDSSDWPTGKKRAWLANCPRINAEALLRNPGPDTPLAELRAAAFLACDDPQEANRRAMAIYSRMLAAKIQT